EAGDLVDVSCGVGTNGLDERLVGRLQVLVAPAVEHHGAAVVRLADELTGQRRLADARLACEHGDTGSPAAHRRPQVAQALELGGAADEDVTGPNGDEGISGRASNGRRS